jgi:type IV secretory pathway VirD2 relaxase
MNSTTDSLEERVRHLELLILFMQAEISTLRNLVKRSSTRDEVEEEILRRFNESHQQQFRSLFANLPNRAAVIRQIVADYASRLQLELDHSENVP